MPYRLVGATAFYERAEIKDLLSYLRFLANPNDTVSLERILNVPKRGLGPAAFKKILACLEHERRRHPAATALDALARCGAVFLSWGRGRPPPDPSAVVDVT